MKLALLLISACFAATVHTKAVQAPLHLISLEDLTEEDRRHLELLNKEAASRSKRSGSGDLLGTIAHALGKTLKKKITQIARSSVSASGHFSSGLSGGENHHHHEEHHVPHKDDSFDWWSLKKSILNTLLQAVKAIKGGVIAINGQLLKGSGYLISAKGKLLASKGDSVTELGKKIASSALLSPHPSHHGAVTLHEAHHHIEEHPPLSSYGPPPTHYGVPSAPAPAFYHPVEPSSPGVYEPQKFGSHYADDSVAYGAESGIVILKKIPKGHQQKNKHKGEAESTIPEFKPLESDGSDEYSFKNIVGKFFHASTSLQPDNAPTHDIDEIEVDEPHAEAPSKPAPVVYDTDDDFPPSKPSPSTFLASKKPNTFEAVNYETHPELYEQETKPDESQDSFKLSQKEVDFLKNYLINLKHNESQFVTKNFSSIPTKTSYNPEELPSLESFPPYPGEFPPEFIAKYGQPIQKFASPLTLPNPPSNPFNEFKTNTIDVRYKRYPQHYHQAPPSPFKQKIRFSPRPIRPPSKHFPPPQRLKSQPPVNLVKSVTYKLTPNGPIKV